MSAHSIHVIIPTGQQEEANSTGQLTKQLVEWKKERRTVRKVRQSRLAQSEAGQASIEFALTITMTLLLIFALIDFSRAIYTASILQWAAQDGAREAIVMIDSSASAEEIKVAVEAAVKERLVGLDHDAVVIA